MIGVTPFMIYLCGLVILLIMGMAAAPTGGMAYLRAFSEIVLNFLRGVFDMLDSDGGHIFLLMCLLMYGAHIGSMELESASLGALMYSFKNKGSNRQQAASTTVSAATTTVAAAPAVADMQPQQESPA